MPNTPVPSPQKDPRHADDPLMGAAWYEIEVELLRAQVELDRMQLGMSDEFEPERTERANLPEAVAGI